MSEVPGGGAGVLRDLGPHWTLRGLSFPDPITLLPSHGALWPGCLRAKNIRGRLAPRHNTPWTLYFIYHMD
jgi:hypothetical protein